jgi:DNA-binding MarR family transcriptional regulator
MSKLTTLADIDRAYALFSNHTAIAILDVLGRGEKLNGAAELSVDQQTISDAVALLRKMDLVTPAPEPSDVQPVVLTSRGRSLVDLLEDISRDPT